MKRVYVATAVVFTTRRVEEHQKVMVANTKLFFVLPSSKLFSM